MKIIKSDLIKQNIITNIRKKHNKKILIISQSKDQTVIKYKDAIINRCREFGIEYNDLIIEEKCDHVDILKQMNKIKDCDGFILLQPLGEKTDISYLRENINLRDLDGFTHKSLGKMMDNNFEYLPQTTKSIIKFLDFIKVDLKGKDVIIANSSNVIGRPLALYLNSKKATVTLFNSKTLDQKDKIKKCDIFISAIGKAHYYKHNFFRDGQILIDVGMSIKDGKLVGDIDIDSLKDLDVEIVTSKGGVGSITTLSLLETL